MEEKTVTACGHLIFCWFNCIVMGPCEFLCPLLSFSLDLNFQYKLQQVEFFPSGRKIKGMYLRHQANQVNWERKKSTPPETNEGLQTSVCDQQKLDCEYFQYINC